MGRTIFSNTNRVVSKDVNHRNFHDCREPQRASSVVAEDQKPGAKSSELSQRQSVQDCPHCMLANPEMNIPPPKRLGPNLSSSLESKSRLGGRRKIRRTSYQPGVLFCYRVQDFAGRIATREPLRVSR